MRERTTVKDVLWGLAFAGAVAMVLRLTYGLGATTHLTDSVPWGLWKILNMVAGVALSTGGFTVGLLVYVLKLERFRPLVKPAILLAFLGYGSSCFALFLDIGLPHRIWHPLVMWNERSFLFEVAWCVMLYFTVTVIELSPTLLERLRMAKIAHALHRIAPVVVIIGIALSSLHHSSLGSLFLVTPQRLHPLWFSPRLPFFFILSAMGTGMMVVVLAKMLYARWYDRTSVFALAGPRSAATPAEPPHLRIVRQLAGIAAGVLALYLVLKIADLFATGAWPFLAAGTWESWLYVADLALNAAIPVALMTIPRARRSPAGIAVAAGSAALGLVLNRLDVGVFGYFRDAGKVYFPSLAEWALSLGIFAAAGLLFLKLSESTEIFDARWRERERTARRFTPTFDAFSRVWRTSTAGGYRRISLIAVLVVPVAWAALYPPFRAGREQPVSPPLGLDAVRASLLIGGAQPRMAVAFPHGAHVQRSGGASSCSTCHHLSLPGDHATACARCHRRMEAPTHIFDHAAHFETVARAEKLGGPVPGNASCGECHRAGEPRSASTARACQDCHAKRTAAAALARSGAGGRDMSPSSPPETPHAWASAPGYRAAMHQACIGCHRRSAASGGRGGQLLSEHLTRCSTCHASLQPRQATAIRAQLAQGRPTPGRPR